jgi:hypothetical protein
MEDRSLRKALIKIGMFKDPFFTTTSITDKTFGNHGYITTDDRLDNLAKKLSYLISYLGLEDYKVPAKTGFRKIKKKKH